MPKRATKTKTKEVPITAMPPDRIPDQELGRQWNELYPVGTEIIYSIPEVSEPHHSNSQLHRLTEAALHDSKRPAGWRDYIKVDGSKISLRNHIFPAASFPDVAKRLRNDQVLETCGMKKPSSKNQTEAGGQFSEGLISKYQKTAKRKIKTAQPKTEKPSLKSGTIGKPSRKFSEPIVKSQGALSQIDDESLRQDQLLEAYQDRAAILERLDGFNPNTDRFKPEKDRIRKRIHVFGD